MVFCRFAFVDYDSAEGAAAAVSEHNNREVDGRRLHVSPARSQCKSRPRKSVLVFQPQLVFDRYQYRVDTSSIGI